MRQPIWVAQSLVDGGGVGVHVLYKGSDEMKK